MHSSIQPHSYVVLRLPSSTLKIVQVVPNTIVSIGKFGSFPANLLLGRPYHLTFDILEKNESNPQTDLRIVSAAELHAEAILDEGDSPSESRDELSADTADGVEYDVQDDGSVTLRSNQNTIDDPNRQSLSLEDIEELKKLSTGRDIIELLMKSHSGLDEKTAFSLAKYAVRKRGKYLKRFTVLPLDVSLLLEWVLTEKEAPRIMELREELLGLVLCWSNVHHMMPLSNAYCPDDVSASGRWLVIDETSGLIVAALAEKIGVLYEEEEDEEDEERELPDSSRSYPQLNGMPVKVHQSDAISTEEKCSDTQSNGVPSDSAANRSSTLQPQMPVNRPPKHSVRAQSATSNSITLLHAATQPNISLLKYFGYDDSNANEKHHLFMHLKTLSWLQLLSPEADSTYQEPEVVPDNILQTWRGGKKSSYFRKRRRWERVKDVIDDTRRGDFDGLVIASVMEPAEILRHLLPLLKGGAPVVVFSPNVEPLVKLTDLFSKARRTAFMTNPPDDSDMPTEDFPIDPTLMLNTMLQTSRARSWQVLPGRTHPLMMARGGAEGYIFTGTRVLKGEGAARARGRFSKKRKIERGEEIEDDS
ncbi:hypothetical protein EV356DRAFT_559543 [Viridothelium virens]|uniref:tRNA (adenine(58)-N(1))-methyltransferase non-catalytic subunit TRM6 n=1 Tax=Viridothelium virens TaxID=1048519 RepID=A0A6A6H8B4_VIRVR|nr:hypothetical protein EV356DRAFT_559543 [Viridothelium virens]